MTEFSPYSAQAQPSNTTRFQISDPAQLRNDDYLLATRNALDKVPVKPDSAFGILNAAATAIETDVELEVLAAPLL